MYIDTTAIHGTGGGAVDDAYDYSSSLLYHRHRHITVIVKIYSLCFVFSSVFFVILMTVTIKEKRYQYQDKQASQDYYISIQRMTVFSYA